MKIACPHCGDQHDAATFLDHPQREPKAGDVGICINCGGFFELTLTGRAVPCSAMVAAGLPLEAHRASEIIMTLGRKRSP